jgi:hypothetical protein
MRLPVKLSLLLAGATCFPLLLVTAFTLPQGREALRSQLDQIYAQDARALAAEVHRTLVDKLDSLTLAASTLRLGALDPEARQQALLLIYKETRGADVVGLFDSRGDAVGQEIYFAHLQGELASEHEPIDAAGLSAYAGKVPLQGALQAGLAVGPVYVLPDAQGRPIPRLVLAVSVPGARNQRWVLASVRARRARRSCSTARAASSSTRKRPSSSSRPTCASTRWCAACRARSGWAPTPPYRSWGGRSSCRSPPTKPSSPCATSSASRRSGSRSAFWWRWCWASPRCAP